MEKIITDDLTENQIKDFYFKLQNKKDSVALLKSVTALRKEVLKSNLKLSLNLQDQNQFNNW